MTYVTKNVIVIILFDFSIIIKVGNAGNEITFKISYDLN